MSARYKILRRLDKVNRRRLRNHIVKQAYEEKRKVNFLSVKYVAIVFNDNDCPVTENAVREWARKGLLGKAKKIKGRWAITKKNLGFFMKRMEEIDDEMEPYRDVYRKPRKKRQSGIKSKRESSFVAQGLVIPNIR